GDAAFLAELVALVEGSVADVAYHLLHHGAAFVAVVAEAELDEHVREPHEAEADAALVLDGVVDLLQGGDFGVEHVVEEAHGEAGGLLEAEGVVVRLALVVAVDEGGEVEGAEVARLRRVERDLAAVGAHDAAGVQASAALVGDRVRADRAAGAVVAVLRTGGLHADDLGVHGRLGVGAASQGDGDVAAAGFAAVREHAVAGLEVLRLYLLPREGEE